MGKIFYIFSVFLFPKKFLGIYCSGVMRVDVPRLSSFFRGNLASSCGWNYGRPREQSARISAIRAFNPIPLVSSVKCRAPGFHNVAQLSMHSGSIWKKNFRRKKISFINWKRRSQINKVRSEHVLLCHLVSFLIDLFGHVASNRSIPLFVDGLSVEGTRRIINGDPSRMNVLCTRLVISPNITSFLSPYSPLQDFNLI